MFISSSFPQECNKTKSASSVPENFNHAEIASCQYPFALICIEIPVHYVYIFLKMFSFYKRYPTVCNLLGLIFSLNIVLLRFIHIIACHCNLFVLAAIHHPLFWWWAPGYFFGLSFAIVKVLKSILFIFLVVHVSRVSLSVYLEVVLLDCTVCEVTYFMYSYLIFSFFDFLFYFIFP